MQIEIAHSISEKKMYAHADLELQLLHISLNPVFFLFGETLVISVLGS